MKRKERLEQAELAIQSIKYQLEAILELTPEAGLEAAKAIARRAINELPDLNQKGA